jgi:hypothetical protein
MKNKNLLVSHGDVDGVISAALLVERHQLNLQETDVVFTQPFLVEKVKTDGYEQIYICDLAVNNREPQMTQNFIKSMGDRLYVWYDHHQGWINSGLTDERFIIDESAPSCATIIGGNQKWIEAANAIDSRKGHSDLGQLLDQAMRVNLSDEEVRRYALEYLLGQNDGSLLQKKQKEYKAIQEKTRQLVDSGEVRGQVLVVDTRGHEGFDRTQLCLLGYERAPYVCLLGTTPPPEKVTTLVATNTKTNLVEVFGLQSGAPFRIGMEGDHVERVINTLNSL